MSNELELYKHNLESYNKIKEQFKKDNIAAIIHATGTGKSYNALQYIYDNKDKKIIYVVPYNGIKEHLLEIIKKNPNVSQDDFKYVEFMTYKGLSSMKDEELETLEFDSLILDEFHHIGAPIWGKKINKLIETHPNIQILGMTAYTIRDKKTPYERDMVNPETDELFSNKVVSRYDLYDAMYDGILPVPIYKSGYIDFDKKIQSIEYNIETYHINKKNYSSLKKVLDDLKELVHEASNISDIFKTNIKPNGKYIYFCPINQVNGINDIEIIKENAKKWVKEMGLSEDDYVFYTSIATMKKEGKNNRLAFYNDEDLEGNSCKNKLRIMFAINQYNEGIHAPDLDGVIMARTTSSDIVYYEQLGRALSVGKKDKEEIELLKTKSVEELRKMLDEREIDYTDQMEKDELIYLLTSPIIIDLVNNLKYIRELENNLKDKVKVSSIGNGSIKEKKDLFYTSFNINMINEKIYEKVNSLYDLVTLTFDQKYEFAKKYYEHYGNLYVHVDFATKDGVNYDPDGFQLGQWLNNIKKRFNYYSDDIKEKFKAIGFIENYKEYLWMTKYELVKKYFEEYGNINVPFNFKTKDGINYDKDGYNISDWLKKQRENFDKISKERKDLLMKLDFVVDKYEKNWNKAYELLEKYYNYYGNSHLLIRFKTKDGINYDEEGIALGNWLYNQRKNFDKLSEEKQELLKKLNIEKKDYNEVFWCKNYYLAKAYYDYNGNSLVPLRFKTKDGINYDENGVPLGKWISNQRNIYSKLSEEKQDLLNKLDFIIDVSEYEWLEYYNLAKAYYEYYGDLLIPHKFRTFDGIHEDPNGLQLGRWIGTKRYHYIRTLSPSNLKHNDMLSDIGMVWISEKKNKQLVKEEINCTNKDNKNRELSNRTYTLIHKYNPNSLPSKEQINNDFMSTLNI